jgi:murein L,D-transpeptidase YafK
VKNPTSRYHRSLGISYPSEEDADRGLAAGLITKREHRSIVAAIRQMQRPPWRTALGGEIGIHGRGADRGDWTQGCIALEDEGAEELFLAIPLGTPVEILP